jgi:bifunctional NMN adenylyltransferase/nudix hydrolase
MSKSKYDLLIFIGRFQPFHLGHKQVIGDACNQARQVLILVGSSFQPRTIKNPFTYEERYNMIVESLSPQEVSKVIVRPLRDYLYNEAQWVGQVQQIVDVIASNPDARIGIIGYEKDESSYYLREFPQWEFVPVRYNSSIDASTIRQLWLTSPSPNYAVGALPTYVYKFMYTTFPRKHGDEFSRLDREYQHITNYKKQWEAAPYAPTFVTCDAVVIQSGHVLLVERKAQPGEGLYALPGGFINQQETIEDAMIRELREETRIKVPEPVLRGSTKSRKVFDAPLRSLRGRTITHAFLIELAPGKLPAVKGGDDAAKAKWVSLAELDKLEDQMFEDHFYIINYFLGRV